MCGCESFWNYGCLYERFVQCSFDIVCVEISILRRRSRLLDIYVKYLLFVYVQFRSLVKGMLKNLNVSNKGGKI